MLHDLDNNLIWNNNKCCCLLCCVVYSCVFELNNNKCYNANVTTSIKKPPISAFGKSDWSSKLLFYLVKNNATAVKGLGERQWTCQIGVWLCPQTVTICAIDGGHITSLWNYLTTTLYNRRNGFNSWVVFRQFFPPPLPTPCINCFAPSLHEI